MPKLSQVTLSVMLRSSASRRLRSIGPLALPVFIATAMLVSASAHGSTLVHGVNRTCRDFADLDYALDHPGSQYFRAWTTDDFDAAETWVASCASAPLTAQDSQRESLLAERRRTLTAQGDIARNDNELNALHTREANENAERERARLAAQQDYETRLAAERNRELAESKARQATAAKEAEERAAAQAAREQCLRSANYMQFVASSHVLQALAQQSVAQNALDHEKRVEEVSETTNLYSKRQAGEMLVSAQEAVSRWFAEYRQYGGEATAPAGVRATDNPCP